MICNITLYKWPQLTADRSVTNLCPVCCSASKADTSRMNLCQTLTLLIYEWPIDPSGVALTPFSLFVLLCWSYCFVCAFFCQKIQTEVLLKANKGIMTIVLP